MKWRALIQMKKNKPASEVLIKLQAEQALYKSTPNLLPYNDRSSPAIEPYHVSEAPQQCNGAGLGGCQAKWDRVGN